MIPNVVVSAGSLYGKGQPYFPWIVNQRLSLLDEIDFVSEQIVDSRPFPVNSVARAACSRANSPAGRWTFADDYVASERWGDLPRGHNQESGGSRGPRDYTRVPELGFVFTGLLDLSGALGHPGEVDHPTSRKSSRPSET